MLFNSYIFILCFLPISVLGYFLINKYTHKSKGGLSLLWLSLVSFCFFGYASLLYVPLLLGSIVVNFIVCLFLKKAGNITYRKLFLTGGIIIQLSSLFYFKYYNFFLEMIDGFIEVLHWNSLAVPLGISFFTFSQISFLVDCYRKPEADQIGFLEYCTYVSFFPKLTMGPIALQKEIIPQLRDGEKKCLSYGNLSRGIYLFALGLAKKVLLADILARLVNTGYGITDELNTATAVVVMVSYTLQLYFDFSGYCDMAKGIALMFNIVLPDNFNSPYKAKSISEYWSRWHMTLTRFFTTYLYIPLGGSRKGLLRTCGNTFFVFMISGLWHGANWTYLIWGVIHGIFMVAEKLIKEVKICSFQLPKVLKKGKACIGWMYMFTVINISMIFFRSESVEQGGIFLTKLCSGGWKIHDKLLAQFTEVIEIRLLYRLMFWGGLNPALFLCCILLLLVFFCVFTKNTQERMEKSVGSVRGAVTVVILLVWCVVSLSSISEFLYFEF